MGEWRSWSWAGCKAGVCKICWRISGEALIKNQCLPSSALTATDTCVDRREGSLHAARQVGQLQFHCGMPPPAADPRMTTFNMDASFDPRQENELLLLCAGVHVDFHANLHFSNFRCVPSHDCLLQKQSNALCGRHAVKGESRPPPHVTHRGGGQLSILAIVPSYWAAASDISIWAIPMAAAAINGGMVSMDGKTTACPTLCNADRKAP